MEATGIRRTIRATVAAGLVAAVVATIGVLGTSRPASASSSSLPTVNNILLDQNGVNYDWSVVAPRYRIIELNSWDYPWIPAIRAANPQVKIWVYKDLTSTRPDECTNGVDWTTLATGVGYCYAAQNHPEWFLTTPSGARLQEAGYPNQYEMDYGNPAYQQAWVAGVLADVRAHGWDGVEMDNALSTADAYGVAAKYPTDASVQAAMYQMLQAVGPPLQAAGVTAVANVGYAPEFPGLWQQWLGPVSGLEQEYFLSWSNGPDVTGSQWQTYEAELTSAVAQHKMIYAHAGSYTATSTQLLDYTVASFLLGTDGNSVFSFGSTVQDYPEYHYNLGTPTGSYFARWDGSYERDFTNGTVVVNPNNGTGAINIGPGLGANNPPPVVGDAGFYGSAGSLPLNRPVVGMAATPDGKGYWMVASDGGIFTYGDAGFYGSAGSLPLNRPIVGMASTPDGRGYWLVASDGGIFTYGDAGFYGSAGWLPLNQPIVGMASTPDGHGYWLVAADGGIFTYGDAGFYGSGGWLPLNRPIVGMASTPSGHGYWMVASDGGIFTYGDAGFYGSAGNLPLNQPVVGMASTPSGHGYWMVASDGGIFTYGDAGFYGSTGGMVLNRPIVGMATPPTGKGYWLVASDGGIFAEG
jgi:hypothetical protein